VKERPILFNGAMVRAVLANTKTQTRRVVTPQPRILAGELLCWKDDALTDDQMAALCPHGRRGDRLWVRESTRMRYLPNILTGEPTNAKCGEYLADGRPVLNEDGFDLAWWYSRNACPSIHMPRWASRIDLEVTGVRVERLQDISRADAVAEGAPPSHPSIDAVSRSFGYADFSRSWYAQLWELINGPGSWDANPWVWCVAFRPV
jgi:hypothetical protein